MKNIIEELKEFVKNNSGVINLDEKSIDFAFKNMFSCKIYDIEDLNTFKPQQFYVKNMIILFKVNYKVGLYDIFKMVEDLKRMFDNDVKNVIFGVYENIENEKIIGSTKLIILA